MKSKLIHIIICLTIFLGILGALTVYTYNTTMNDLKQYTILSKNSEIIVDETGLIDVVDNIKINVIKNERKKVFVPITLFEGIEDEGKVITDVIVYLDGELLSRGTLPFYEFEYSDYHKSLYEFYSSNVVLYDLPLGTHNIRLEYMCYSEDIVKQYNDVTILELRNDTEDIEKTNIDIILPMKSDNISTSNKKAVVNYLGENKYNLDIQKRIFDKNIKLKIDKGIINQGITIDEDYIKSELNKEKEENIIYVGVLGSATILLFVVVMILTKKVKVKEYVRETDSILDPIMAEAIIDRKIGAKELIMSCIADLISKGNLKNIGNEAIEIINLKDITDYEQDIVSLIFKGKKKIKFDDIDKVFLNELAETKVFYKLLKSIKTKILNKLYNDKIYNKSGDIILKIIKFLSIFIFGNAFGLINLVAMNKELNIKSILTINIIIVIAILILLLISKSSLKDRRSIRINRKHSMLELIVYLIFYIVAMIAIIVTTAKEHIIVYSGCTLVLIINLIIIKRTKLHVFTKKGKEEYKKVAGLKKYIIDYSLMEQRELDSIILWDEYLAYSVAFGISNKVSKMFNEKLMNANIVIQRIDKILHM